MQNSSSPIDFRTEKWVQSYFSWVMYILTCFGTVSPMLAVRQHAPGKICGNSIIDIGMTASLRPTQILHFNGNLTIISQALRSFPSKPAAMFLLKQTFRILFQPGWWCRRMLLCRGRHRTSQYEKYREYQLLKTQSWHSVFKFSCSLHPAYVQSIIQALPSFTMLLRHFASRSISSLVQSSLTN